MVDRFADVAWLDIFTGGEVGYSPRDLQNSVVSVCRQALSQHCLFKQRLAIRIERAKGANMLRGHRRVRVNPLAVEPF